MTAASPFTFVPPTADATASPLQRGVVAHRRREPDILRVDGLHKSFSSGKGGALVAALWDVELRATRQEIVGLCGGAASGKTTLLRCISGLMRPDSGSVFWFGSRFHGGGCLPGLSFVPQAPDYYPFLTARDALEYHVDDDGAPPAARRCAIADALRSVGLGDEVDTPVRELDKSQVAALSIAEALASSPRAIVIDGTLDAIDAQALTPIRNALAAFSLGGGTTLVASRNLDVLAGLAARVLRLESGRIAIESDATPSRLVAERRH